MSDEQEILKLFEDGDRALMSGDVAELHRIYAEDYEQYDESGSRSTRHDLIERLTSKALRFLAMRSRGRRIRFLTGEVAVVHGSEEDDVELGGERQTVRYVYSDVVMNREGRWQIVASQLAKAA